MKKKLLSIVLVMVMIVALIVPASAKLVPDDLIATIDANTGAKYEPDICTILTRLYGGRKTIGEVTEYLTGTTPKDYNYFYVYVVEEDGNGAYVVTETYTTIGRDKTDGPKTDVEIPENGFLVCIYAGNEEEWQEKASYIRDNVKIGDLVVLENIDLVELAVLEQGDNPIEGVGKVSFYTAREEADDPADNPGESDPGEDDVPKINNNLIPEDLDWTTEIGGGADCTYFYDDNGKLTIVAESGWPHIEATYDEPIEVSLYDVLTYDFNIISGGTNITLTIEVDGILYFLYPHITIAPAGSLDAGSSNDLMITGEYKGAFALKDAIVSTISPIEGLTTLPKAESYEITGIKIWSIGGTIELNSLTVTSSVPSKDDPVPPKDDSVPPVFTLTTDKESYNYGDTVKATFTITNPDGTTDGLEELYADICTNLFIVNEKGRRCSPTTTVYGISGSIEFTFVDPELKSGTYSVFAEQLGFDSDLPEEFLFSEECSFDYTRQSESTVIVAGEDIGFGNSGDINIDASGATSVVFSFDALMNAWNNLVDSDWSLVLEFDDATVTLDEKAVAALKNYALETGENVTISVKAIDEDALNEAQQNALKDKDVQAYISLEAWAGETQISDFGDGKVTVSVPFELPEGVDADDLSVAYVADDGTITVLPTSFIDGALVFETTHFSDYVVLADHADNSDTSVDDNPDTGDGYVVLWSIMMIFGVASVAVIYTRKRKSCR